MTKMNLVREPLRTAPFVIELPRSTDVYARRQEHRIERMAVLLRHKETVLREVHHRVGNSLQIVASILALDARQVHSKEARLHLANAHRRILAVAAVQQQLQTSCGGGEVELAAYLRQLCENLTASVVGDSTRIAIDVVADAGTVASAVATNMGLIVTELVINALKHAFRADAGTGRIMVTYRAEGHGWRLTVSDNGTVDLNGDQHPSASGLGTGIVAVLVQQLEGRIEISAGLHGRSVSITHGVFTGPATDHAFLASSRDLGRGDRDGKDRSIRQARWLLISLLVIFVAVAVVGSIVAM